MIFPKIRRQVLATRICVLAICLQPGTGTAGNGLNLIGFGTESVSMGSADLAVARDTAAMNSNPAGLTQIRKARFDFYAGAGFAIGVEHHDRLGNDRSLDNSPQFLAAWGTPAAWATARWCSAWRFSRKGDRGSNTRISTPRSVPGTSCSVS